jgi:hypothetical protein
MTYPYRFVGSYAAMPNDGIKADHYGQLVDLTEAQAQSAVLAGVGFLPDELFQTAGHTKEELDKFNTTAKHADAPPEFLAKRDHVWDLARKHREAVVAAAAAKE